MERFERVAVRDLKQEARSHRDRLLQGHRVNLRLEALQNAAGQLAEIYKDEDGARKEDIAALAADPNNMFRYFNDVSCAKEGRGDSHWCSVVAGACAWLAS